MVGRKKRPTLADVQEQYLPSVLAQESQCSIHCVGMRADWVCPVVRCILEAYCSDPGVRGIDQSLANASQLGKGLGTSWFELWLSCCSMIPRSPRSKRTRRRATCGAIRCYEKAGFEARYRNHPRWSSRVHGSNTPGIRANTRCCLTLPSRGTSKGWRPWPPLMSNVKHHEGR